jgi:hypothetical protein
VKPVRIFCAIIQSKLTRQDRPPLLTSVVRAHKARIAVVVAPGVLDENHRFVAPEASAALKVIFEARDLAGRAHGLAASLAHGLASLVASSMPATAKRSW